MFALEGRETSAHLRDQAEVDTIIRSLTRAGYTAVLRSGASATLQALTQREPQICSQAVLKLVVSNYGPVRSAVPMRIAGELFTKDGDLLALVPVGTKLQAWAVSRTSASDAVASFAKVVEDQAREQLDGRRLRGMTWNWATVALDSLSSRTRVGRRPVNGLKKKPVELHDGDTEIAELLQSSETRAFVRRLAQLGKARSVDAVADTSGVSAQALMEHGAIRQEFLLVCRQDSHTLCTVQDRQEIENSGFNCSICGRKFPDELVQEVYALTDLGRRMLNSSHWMTVWVTKALMDLGVPKQAIAWGGTAGEDELDIIVELFGGEVFFELKDREFGLGDAYPFSSRVQRYGGTAGVVISTEGVAEEVKKFLGEQQRTAPQRMYTIERDSDLEPELRRILDLLSHMAIRRTLSLVFEQVGLSIGPLVDAWAVDSRAGQRRS